MIKKIWFLAVVLLLGFFLATSLNRTATKAFGAFSNSNTEQPIVIGYSNWAGWWPWAIAESEGMFAKHGVNVDLKWYDNYTNSMIDLATGEIDGNSQTLNDTISFANDAAKGEVVVLVNDNSAGNDKIIARKGIERIKDLKNKQVVIEAGVVDDFLLTLALEREGMRRDDVNIIDVETGAAVEAFAAGEADAVGAFAPFWLTAFEREGAKEIISSAQFPGAIPDLLVVTQELVDKHPEQVQKLVDVWFDVLEFMKNSPREADEIMAHRAQVSREELELFKKGTKMFNREENIEAFKYGSDMKYMPFAASKMINFLQHSFKSIDREPDINKLFNNSFITQK